MIVMRLQRAARYVAPQAAILAFVTTAVMPAAAQAQDTSSPTKGALQAKIEYCKTCHGLSGQGYRGFYPIPRLAGQQTVYFENQLRAFSERRRANRFMYSVAHTLSPSTRIALAAHFRSLNPKPLGGAPREPVAAGRKIYEEGIPETNVPACLACHGPDARGQEAIPRLAGQLHDYLFNKLVNWTKERGLDPSNLDSSTVMAATSHAMTRSQVTAVAAYLSVQQ
jgi:cytochrome c553